MGSQKRTEVILLPGAMFQKKVFVENVAGNWEVVAVFSTRCLGGIKRLPRALTTKCAVTLNQHRLHQDDATVRTSRTSCIGVEFECIGAFRCTVLALSRVVNY